VRETTTLANNMQRRIPLFLHKLLLHYLIWLVLR